MITLFGILSQKLLLRLFLSRQLYYAKPTNISSYCLPFPIAVQHVAKTSKTPQCPSSKSWIEHWKNSTGHSTPACAIVGCNNVATDGSHVEIVGLRGKQSFIIPTCGGKHNPPGSTGNAFVKGNTFFVLDSICINC